MNIKKSKMLFVVLLDILAFYIALVVSLFLVNGTINGVFRISWVIFIAQILCFYIFKVYKVRLVDSSLELAVRGMSLAVGSIIGFILIFNTHLFEVTTFRIFISYTVLSYFFTMGYRVLYRFAINHRNIRLYNGNNTLNDCRKRAIVFGAGEIGKTLARQSISGKLPYNVLGFIDDESVKHDTLILNKPVYGNLEKLEDTLINTHAKTLIIGITQLSAEKMQEAVAIANGLSIELKIVPSLFELENSDKRTLDLRNIDYKDLLGRKLIEIDKEPIREMIENKVVLVTGACGSIG
ncbi:MAG: nucleoside-diphosphate sugar epimerase/dehydratase, partial [Pleomorphochaeta sp.]